jgi:hypothetical protein
MLKKLQEKKEKGDRISRFLKVPLLCYYFLNLLDMIANPIKTITISGSNPAADADEQPRTPTFSVAKNLCEYVDIFPTSSFALM